MASDSLWRQKYMHIIFFAVPIYRPLICAALVDLDIVIPHVYVCLISGYVL